MNEQAFKNRRESDWQRLSTLCAKADRGFGELTHAEFREMVRLHRRVSSDLALARTRSRNLQLIEYLNSLTGRSYSMLYRAPAKPLLATIVEAIALSAQTVRRNRGFVLVSAALFLGSAFYSFFVIQKIPETQEHFVPASLQPVFDSWRDGRLPRQSASESVAATAMYATNNPFVAVLTGAIAAGSFGVMTAVLLFQNGAMLGALLSYVRPTGRMDFVLSSVFPHGVPELSGIIIAGAAGFRMGWALIAPGRHRRGKALGIAGRDAVTLLATSVVLMFIAAPIEGFFSFNPAVPGWLKTIVGSVTLAGWLVFWSTFARDESEPPL